MTTLIARGICAELGRRRVLEGIDFQVSPGELVGLLGPNGAGKTTLLRVLANLQRPCLGQIRLDDEDIGNYPSRKLARLLAYLPQGRECHWPLAVEDVVALGRLPHRVPWAGVPADDRRRIEATMRYTDILHLRDRPITAVSGGERTRVLLARALAAEPKVLLADEPVAGLDPAHQLDVMHLLHCLATDGAAVVAVLHDLTLAARFCRRLVLLDQGCLVAEGTPEQVLTPENLARCYGIRAHYGKSEGELLVVPVHRTGKPEAYEINTA